ncbi:hypothetical protein TNCV_901521 [Trichonephila clavipes]|nr:hypothetical protein TNCV_901521 [Trichonephila clavipes]
MDWPARSPDINPIEHVWDFLGRRLAACTLPPVTIHELRLALQDEWAAAWADAHYVSPSNEPEDDLVSLIRYSRIAGIKDKKESAHLERQTSRYARAPLAELSRLLRWRAP